MFDRFASHLVRVPEIGLTLDVSRMNFSGDYLNAMAGPMGRAFAAMSSLEGGAIANPDEQRMVGHYWLRSPELAPSPALTEEIGRINLAIKEFADRVHQGSIRTPGNERFSQVVAIGIGGSALGPMLLADALGQPKLDRMKIYFVDNTDPDGIARLLEDIGSALSTTMCLVTSKSGGTPETRNGMLLMEQAYRRCGLEFARHAVAITMPGSQLDRVALEQNWLARFPMLDWVGGRTSLFSAVGLLPAELQGLDTAALLRGAALMDVATRQIDVSKNPAAMLALMWYHATGGQGKKDMVVLPYKDRLLLFSRYLQQLVMESLGKELDLEGRVVEQGLTVYGNKGSTDQHAYVQQLRDGIHNFFTVFIRVLDDGGSSLHVEPDITAGDYLHGFWMGTRQALSEKGRESITISIPTVDALQMGSLIALFERAVGFYASLININAYHQPGVEAGKKAAAEVLTLQRRILGILTPEPRTASQLAQALNFVDAEAVYLVLEHLAANGRAMMVASDDPRETTFSSST